MECVCRILPDGWLGALRRLRKRFPYDEVFGDIARSGHFTKKGEPGDRAMFDAEAPQSAAKFYRLGYTCVRLH